MSSSFADRPLRRSRGVAVLSMGLALLAGAVALPGAAHAADGPRVIEMVSPPDTSGQSAAAGGSVGIQEPPLLGEGVVVGYNLLAPLFPNQGNGYGTLWQARRTAAGWVRGQLDRPAETQDGDEMYTLRASTPDGSRSVIQSEQYQSLFLPGPSEQHVAPSRLALREADGAMREIVSLPFPAGATVPTRLDVTGASSDLETVLFDTPAQLAGDTHLRGSQSYLWRHGALRPAGVDHDGTPLPCGGLSASNVDPTNSTASSVSADGSMAWLVLSDFDANLNSCSTPTHLAAYVDGRTWVVNDPAPGLPASFSSPIFAGSSADGRRVWFKQNDPLTSDDSNADADLYRADLPAGGGQPTLHCVTCSAPDAQVRRAAVTQDRRHVVFSTANAVDGLGVDGSPGGNLFSLADDGRLELITSATLDPDYRVTPDGRYVLGTSADRLTGYDNQGKTEVYRFDRPADGGAYEVTCISCDPAGAPPVAGSPQRVPQGLFGRDNRSISDDGRTIAFVSVDALVPTAVAGVLNLYEWTDGKLSLVYTGLSDLDPRLLGVSPSGDDIYFDAYGRVNDESRQPTDSYYDARRGGGFPAPPTPAAPCVASACQGVPSAPPALPVAATVRLTGEPVPGGRPAAPRRRVRVAKKAVRGSTLRIDVVAPAKGRIDISGTSVRSGRRSVAKAGTYGVAVTLTAKAKRTLERKGRLAVRLKVTFRPAAGSATTATTTVTVKR